MFKTVTTLLTATAVQAQWEPVPQWPNCGTVAGFVNTMDSCGCVDPWSKPVPGTSVCECLDNSTMWMPNGSACGLGNAKREAYVNAMRTRFEPFNNAASRAAADRLTANAVASGALSAQQAWIAERGAWANWWPYRKFWSADYWYYNNRWWPVQGIWWNARTMRQNYINQREVIEAKMEATPWSNQLDLIVDALPLRAGATFTPSSINSGSTQSNQLGRGANAATERNEPMLPFQFDNTWGSLDHRVDDD